jgi:hypothetical protein
VVLQRNIQVPQQANSVDCGAFSSGNMLTKALGLNRSFTQTEIENLRWHMAIQLLRGDLFLPEYHIRATSTSGSTRPSRASTPQSTHSKSDMEAAATLLDFASVAPRGVRFSTEVDIREYKGLVYHQDLGR